MELSCVRMLLVQSKKDSRSEVWQQVERSTRFWKALLGPEEEMVRCHLRSEWFPWPKWERKVELGESNGRERWEWQKKNW